MTAGRLDSVTLRNLVFKPGGDVSHIQDWKGRAHIYRLGLPDRWGSSIFHLEYCVSFALTPWDAWRWRVDDLSRGLGLNWCALNVGWAEKCADVPLANGNEIGANQERQLSSGEFPVSLCRHPCTHMCTKMLSGTFLFWLPNTQNVTVFRAHVFHPLSWCPTSILSDQMWTVLNYSFRGTKVFAAKHGPRSLTAHGCWQGWLAMFLFFLITFRWRLPWESLTSSPEQVISPATGLQ